MVRCVLFPSSSHLTSFSPPLHPCAPFTAHSTLIASLFCTYVNPTSPSTPTSTILINFTTHHSIPTSSLLTSFPSAPHAACTRDAQSTSSPRHHTLAHAQGGAATRSTREDHSRDRREEFQDPTQAPPHGTGMLSCAHNSGVDVYICVCVHVRGVCRDVNMASCVCVIRYILQRFPHIVSIASLCSRRSCKLVLTYSPLYPPLLWYS